MTSLALQRIRACKRIDAAAGAARVKYLTDLPLQSRVYEVKLAQAQAYTAAHALDADATVPPYIAHEAAARGMTALAAAASIISAAAVFDDDKGPAIEGARFAGKESVMACTTEAEIEAAEESAKSALAAL